jgi:hypothetical protein
MKEKYEARTGRMVGFTEVHHGVDMGRVHRKSLLKDPKTTDYWIFWAEWTKIPW